MDAQAHLLSLGWAGPGHPLQPSAYKQKGHRGLAFDPSTTKSSFSQNTYPSNGLIKPLLVSQKQGKLGVGRRAHEPEAGNEWWLKGFEKALGDVGKSESERSSGTSTPMRLPANSGKFGALYAFFVKGGEMEGTIEEEVKQKERRGKKRKSDALDGDEEKKEEKDFEDIAVYIAARDKDEKRRQRREKESEEEQFKAVEAFMEAREGKQRKKRKSEIAEVLADNSLDVPAKAKKQLLSEQTDLTEPSSLERKEERRERRRQRRAEKEARSAAKHETNGDLNGNDGAMTEGLRKAEKKRRKAERALEEVSS